MRRAIRARMSTTINYATEEKNANAKTRALDISENTFALEAGKTRADYLKMIEQDARGFPR